MIVPFHYINNSNISYDQYHFWSMRDVEMMNHALEIAKQGAKFGEIPVGAVVVYEGRILGEGYNCPITTQDPTAHAEIVAVRRACETLNNYRLPKGCILYVTLEPCTMCFGALIHARISRVVFGAFEPKAGVVVSQLKLPEQVFYNHHLSVYGGLLADKSSALLSGFFRQRRQEKRALKTQA
ncbi:tRNA adenosine(34) deaminase TadA [Moraxella catarrhalis]|uniref:tRNA adenosine(34) deaminase TadA n=1 Tax=Moraxella catarrhalis TaxID=480 RepID=UPI00031F90AE|nr:tRNA adenosine(34) deaminase TadA [Moraxella catarrhalis]